MANRHEPILCKRCGDQVRPELSQQLQDVDFCMPCAVAVHFMMGVEPFMALADEVNPGPKLQVVSVPRSAGLEDILTAGGM